LRRGGFGRICGQMSADLAQLVTDIARRARAASLVLATVPTAAKNAALARLEELLPASADALLAANANDLAAAKENGLTGAQIDRLTLNPKRIAQMAEGVRQVAALPDPVGEELERTTRPNGLEIRKIRVPIGVIGIIYEARPNVTIDCAVLCLKSGNAAILRGGKEIFHTNTALAALVTRALASAGLPVDAVQLIPTTDRAALTTLLTLDTLVHCIIPRGGESLIRFVVENSTIPVIKHFKGVCFVYVDHEADAGMAERIVVNAKVQRPRRLQRRGTAARARRRRHHPPAAPGRRLARKKRSNCAAIPQAPPSWRGRASPTAPRRRPTSPPSFST